MKATPREHSGDAGEAHAFGTLRQYDVSDRRVSESADAPADASRSWARSCARSCDRVVHRLGPSPRAATVAGRAALIAKAFETAIVPELALLHPPVAEAASRATRAATVSEVDLATLVAQVLAGDRDACFASIDGLAGRGLTLAQICIDVLAPTARRLGQLWDEERCSFVDVTLGLGTLHSMLQRAGEWFAPHLLPARNPARRVLLGSLSGEQHSFGLAMLGDLFRQSGWDVTTATAMTQADLADACRRDWFAIAGLSVAADERARMLADTIRMIRADSVNPAIGIMVGGPALIQHPELADHAGADIAACDADDVVVRAEGLRVLLALAPAGR
jgi:methanogenic corrinoid protein MtbC1